MATITLERASRFTPTPEKKNVDPADYSPDLKAFLAGDYNKIWERYKHKVQMTVWKVGYTVDHLAELESEAYLLFRNRLSKTDINRIKDPTTWSFSAGFYFEMKRLVPNQYNAYEKNDQHLGYDETTQDVTDGASLRGRVWNIGSETFSPETILFNSSSVQKDAVRALMKSITPVERTIIRMKRKGASLTQIAEAVGKSPTRVKQHLLQCKKIAAKL